MTIPEAVIGGSALTFAGILFGAGRLVESLRNAKFMHKELCAATHIGLDGKLKILKEDLTYIRDRVDELTGVHNAAQKKNH